MPVLLVVSALAVGLLLGALGGGGSILAVPALHALGLSPAQATTSSLIVVIAGSLVAVVPHHRGGRVRLRQGLTFGLLGAAGAALGAWAAAGIDGALLMRLFAVLLLVVAALMVRRALGAGSAARDTTAGGEPRPQTRWPLLLLTATGVGLLTGFFGVGGGFVIVPALVLVLGLPTPVAVGTSLVVIVVTSTIALIARAGLGVPVDWALTAVFAAIAVVGALIGARLAGILPARATTLAFAALLVVVAVLTLL